MVCYVSHFQTNKAIIRGMKIIATALKLLLIFFIHMDHSSCKRTSYESLSCHIDKILTNTVTTNNCEFDIKRQKFENIIQTYKAEILP